MASTCPELINSSLFGAELACVNSTWTPSFVNNPLSSATYIGRVSKIGRTAIFMVGSCSGWFPVCALQDDNPIAEIKTIRNNNLLRSRNFNIISNPSQK
jgi:hypothetical protein